MKPKSTLRNFLALAGSSILAVSSASAITLYWDGSTTLTANADGGAGAWNGTDLWDTLAIAGANASWTSGDFAVFGGALGAVTTGAPITTSGIQFNTTGYTITADSTNTLSFSTGNNSILFNNVAAATISGTVANTAANIILSTTNPFTAGNLTFNGLSASGWSGTTTINAGMTLTTTSVGANINQVLNDTSGITLNGGKIQFNRDTNADINAISDTAAIGVYGGGTFSVTATNGGASAIEDIGAVTVNSGQMNFVQTANIQNSLVLTSLGRGLSTTSAVTFSAPTSFATTKFVVGGAGGATTATQIFAPWATTGTAATAQTDYAVFNASNEIGAAGASLAVTAESGWSSATTAYQFGTTQTLADNRTAAALRYTAGANPLALNGFTLKTNGILNGGSGTLTISGAGALTATGTSGGNLFLTTGNNAITVSSAINDNGGAVTLVKGGAASSGATGTLTLSSTSSNYSGGTVINAGSVAITADANLGAATGGLTFNGTGNITYADGLILNANRTITFNAGANVSLSNAITFNGILTGSGAFSVNTADGFWFKNANNDFQGTITVGTAGATGYGLEMASIGDLAGAGLINLGITTNGGAFRWAKTTGGTTTLSNRQFALSGTTGTQVISALGTSAAENLIITKDLLVTGVGAKTLSFAGTNLGDNTFSGMIADGTDGGTSVIGLAKSEGGKWILSNDYTYTGATTITGGTLQLGAGSTTGKLSTSSAITLAGGTFAINRSDAVAQGTDFSGAILTGAGGFAQMGAGTTTLNVANTYSGATTVTGGTLALTNNQAIQNSALTFSAASQLNLSGVTTPTIGGLNSSVNLALVTGYNSGVTALTLNPATGVTATYSGIISNGAATNLLLTKSGLGIQVLSNNNTFSGGLAVSAGTLRLSGNQTFLGGVTLTGGNFGDSTDGISAIELDDNTITVDGVAGMGIANNETLNSGSSILINSLGSLSLGSLGTGTVNGAISGTGTLKMTSAPGSTTQNTVNLNSTANTFTGGVTILPTSNGGFTLGVNSLADSGSLGAGNIVFPTNSAVNAIVTFVLNSGAVAPLTFTNRQIEISGLTAPGSTYKLANNSTQAFTINSNLNATGSTGVKTLTLGGTGAGLGTFGGTITNGGLTTLNLAKVDANNIWALTNTANTYNGTTTITAGTLQVSSLAGAGADSSIGTSTGAGGLILNGGTLRYAGALVSTDRTLSLAASSSIDASGTGPLTFSAANLMPDVNLTGTFTSAGAIVTGISSTADMRVGMTVTSTAFAGTKTISSINSGSQITLNNGTGVAAGSFTVAGGTPSARTLTLTGINTGANTVAGILGDSTAAGAGVLSIVKSGVGTWVLAGNNSYTGSTTLNAGTLKLNYDTVTSGTNSSKLSNTASTGTLLLNGGTLELNGGSHTETVLSTTLTAGTSFVNQTGGGSSTLSMGVITYTSGALNFSGVGIANVAASAVTNGILSSSAGAARVTVGGADWAAKDGSNNVIAYTGYDPTNYAGTAMTGNVNYKLLGSASVTTNRGASSNTLKITTDAGSQSTAISTGATFTLGSLLFAGADDYAISTAGTGKIAATLLHNYGAGTLTLGTLGVELTQYGTGTTILNGGTAGGDYGMNINGGTVQISNNLQIGNNTTAKAITLNNGTLQASDNVALNNGGLNSRTITLGAGGGTLAAASTKALTVSGVISGAGNPLTAGSVSNTGTVILSGANTYTGATTVGGGTLNVSAGSINTTSALTVAAGARLAYNSSTALTVAPTLNGNGLSNRAVLGGTGTINTAVILDNIGDTLSPGNSPGIQTFTTNESWAAFSYDWEVKDFSATTGLTAGSDFDQIAITGGLTLTGAAANSYYLNVLSLTAGDASGLVPNFSEISRSWNILTTTTGITGFNDTYWNIDKTGFTNLENGTWSIGQDGNNLVLTYVIPEPRAALLGGIGILLLLRRRRN